MNGACSLYFSIPYLENTYTRPNPKVWWSLCSETLRMRLDTRRLSSHLLCVCIYKILIPLHHIHIEITRDIITENYSVHSHHHFLLFYHIPYLSSSVQSELAFCVICFCFVLRMSIVDVAIWFRRQRKSNNNSTTWLWKNSYYRTYTILLRYVWQLETPSSLFYPP